jgi:putative N6-adenine-specific DNA methylase
MATRSESSGANDTNLRGSPLGELKMISMKGPVPLSPEEKFFLVVTPGFERLALYELHRHLAQQLPEWRGEPVLFAGGVEVLLPLAIGLQLNRHLRIPTRVLLRIASQKDILLYQDLQKWLRTLSVKKYFPYGEIFVSTRSSKLKMKDKIKNVFANSFQFQSSPKGPDVYIRFFRDECTVSLDTTGDELFRRGQNKWVGEAPIRETMAAALLQLTTQGIEDLSQWAFLDPMMGSGTLLLEAAQMNHVLQREFSYENWLDVEKNLGVMDKKVPSPVPSAFAKIYGRDIEKQNLELAQKNVGSSSPSVFELKCEDVFKGAKEKLHQPLMVLINPPYGKRLKIKNEFFYTDLINVIVERFSPERIGIIVPRGKEIKKPAHYEQVRYLEFSNNGIDVHFHVLLLDGSRRS